MYWLAHCIVKASDRSRYHIRGVCFVRCVRKVIYTAIGVRYIEINCLSSQQAFNVVANGCYQWCGSCNGQSCSMHLILRGLGIRGDRATFSGWEARPRFTLPRKSIKFARPAGAKPIKSVKPGARMPSGFLAEMLKHGFTLSAWEIPGAVCSFPCTNAKVWLGRHWNNSRKDH